MLTPRVGAGAVVVPAGKRMKTHTSATVAPQPPDHQSPVDYLTSSLEVDARLTQDVNFWGRLKDPEMRRALDLFNLSNQTISSLFTLNLFVSMLCVQFCVLAVLDVGDFLDRFHFINWGAMVAVGIALSTWTWVVYFQLVSIMKANGGNLSLQSRTFLRCHQLRVVVILTVWTSYLHILSVVVGNCRDQADLGSLQCNSAKDGSFIPPETTALLMLYPLLYSISVRGANLRYAGLLWSVVVVVLLISVVYANSYSAYIFLVFYCLQSAAILLEARKQNYFLFFTHQKLQSVLDERQRQSDEANATEMRHMIANVAHDLKTPLASFLGGIEFIAHVVEETRKKATVTRMEQEECMTSLLECVANMRNTNSFMLMTINRCIDYTKASKGVKLVPKYETVDLQEALALPLNCMKDIQQRIPIVLVPLAGDICSHVITDKQWLQENVLCLLSNAVKNSSEGEVSITVSLEPQILGDHSVIQPAVNVQDSLLRVEVEDHGIGLSEEAMDSLFSPFKQAQRMAGGTGLGLFSLAKRLEALGGRYGVSRRRDNAQGALFWFELPYRPDHQTAAFSSVLPALHIFSKTMGGNGGGTNTDDDIKNVRCPSPTSSYSFVRTLVMRSSATGTSMSSPRTSVQNQAHCKAQSCGPEVLRVLVVDDSPAILKMTSMMLKRHQHVVTTATNGAEAVKVVADHVQSGECGFDVILMDLQMPVMDGLEAMKRIRALERGGGDVCVNVHHRMIGVSACSDQLTTTEALRSGADAFIAKPFSMDALYSVYKEVVAASVAAK